MKLRMAAPYPAAQASVLLVSPLERLWLALNKHLQHCQS